MLRLCSVLQLDPGESISQHCVGQRLQQCGRMAAGDAWLLLQTRVLAAISYPLALTSFTTKKCCKLSFILDNAMSPKLGINRKMKQTVVYAPAASGT